MVLREGLSCVPSCVLGKASWRAGLQATYGPEITLTHSAPATYPSSAPPDTILDRRYGTKYCLQVREVGGRAA